MRQFSRTICAALALTFAAGTAPLHAQTQPLDDNPQPKLQLQAQNPGGEVRRQRRDDRVETRQDRRDDRSERREDRRDERADRREDRRDARFERRGQYGYYNGRRGFRERRAGYRYYNGYWFPPAAFVLGAIVGGAVNNSGGRSAHVEWCYDRYRSYRASDNTYVSSGGGRRLCNSPYN